jgi:acetylornithine deacetylase/succinyl-diaminopimelate desuccinylase-like protein
MSTKKWTFRRSALQATAAMYGRGTLDDKDNLVASLMTVLLLHRMKVPPMT